MGNWQLEVWKFAVYLTVPVGAFYAFNNKTEWFKDYLYYYEKKAQSPKMRENYSTMLEYRDEIRDIENVKHRAQLQREAQLSDAIRASQEAKVAASQE